MPERKWRRSCRKSIHSDMELEAARCCWRCWPKVETGALRTSCRLPDHRSPRPARWQLTSAPVSNSWSGFRCPTSWSRSDEKAAPRWSCSRDNDMAARCEECTSGPAEWFGRAPNHWSPPGYHQTSSFRSDKHRERCEMQIIPIRTLGNNEKYVNKGMKCSPFSQRKIAACLLEVHQWGLCYSCSQSTWSMILYCWKTFGHCKIGLHIQ